MSEVVTRPPFDPEVAAVLKERRDEVVTGLAPDEIAALRARAADLPPLESLTLGGRFTLSTLEVHGPAAGSAVELVLLRPALADGPVPVLLHVHGGGLIAGRAHDDLVPTLELADATGCAVASVEYRLAPEHPYPAAVDDVYAALSGLIDAAGRLGLDRRRVVLHGVSAGGGLAAAAGLLARDRGGPQPAGLLLVCPMLDDRNDTASAHQMQGHGAWDRTANATGWQAYLPAVAGTAEVPGYAAPGREQDLAGLPPAFLDVGSAETFRDEVVAFASRLWSCGGDAELHVWPGGVHGFDFLAPKAAVSRAARGAREDWLRRVLARVG